MSILLFGGKDYLDKIHSVEPANLVGAWLQDEGSGSISYDHSGHAFNGAYTGVTLGQPGVPEMGLTSPFYDGTNDYNDVFSAGLAADINKDELTVGIWGKINAASLWTDAVAKEIFRLRFGGGGGGAYLRAYKSGTAGQIVVVRYEGSGGGGAQTITWTTGSPTGFFSMFITQSIAGDALKLYDSDGVQVGATQTGLSTYEGTLDQFWIGDSSGGPGAPWHGWLAPTMLWKTPLAVTQVAYLSKV